MIGSVAASALMLALNGCATTGGIEPRSRLIDPRSIRMGAAVEAANKNAAWPVVDWWRRWKDPQLDALVQQAIADHPDLRAAQARLDLAQARARIAGASTSVQFGTEGNFSRERYPRYTTPSPPGGYTVWSNSVGIDLSYDLDLWGKNRAILAGATDAARATNAEMHGVQLALETAVVRAYVQLSMQYELLDADVALQAQAQRSRDIVLRRLRAGLGNRLELSQAEAQLAISSTQVEQANQQIGLIQHQIAALTGHGPSRGESITRPRLAPDLEVALPDVLPAELIGHRPDIVAQRWQVEATSKGIAAAHAAFYPNINLLAAADLGSATTFGGFFNFLDKEAAGHSVGIALSLPIFDGGRLQGQYGAAVATHDLAVESYNQALITAVQQVADQVISLRSLAVQQTQAEQALAQADMAYKLAEQGYRAGITEFLDVLVAQATQSRQQQLLATIHARRLDAWALLMQALGGGLESPTPAQRPAKEGGDHAS